MHNFVGDALRNNHPLLFWVLLAFAAVPAAVTAVSVWLAISDLIPNPLLGAMFATAALVLDLFKALALPLALGLLGMRRWFGALVMLFCAIGMGGFSAWATFDRLMSETYTSHQVSDAVQDQRIADLEEQRRADAEHIEQLDARAVVVSEQAAALRARDFARRAQELEDAELARIDAQRDAAIARRDAASQELTALRSQPVKAAGTPLEAAALLFLGFAVVLEVMPAVILSNLRPAPAAAAQQVAEREPVTVAEEQERTEEPAGTMTQERPETAQDKACSEECVADSALPEPLLQLIASTESGTKMAVRRVAKELRIGSDKATKLMQKAAGMGVLNKTDAGYVTA